MTLLRQFPRFRRAYQQLGVLARRESWSRSEIESWQLERINSIWAHARLHVPYYRTLSNRLLLPHRFVSLEEFRELFPICSKADLRENVQAFLSDRSHSGEWLRTGGSTGQPVRVFWGKQAGLEINQARYRYYDAWGIDIFDRSAIFWGPGSSSVAGALGWLTKLRRPIEDLLRNRVRFSTYDLRPADLDRYLDQLARCKPITMYGFTSAVDLLARHAANRGFACDSLKLITLTGETITSACVRNVEQAFRAPATAEYGSSECGILAQEYPDRTLRVREDLVYLETIPTQQGLYQVVATVLTNPSFPLLRYRLGDLTSHPLEIPERGFAVLRDLLGRTTDFLRTRTGNRIHSSRLDLFFREQCPGVRRFRVHQRAEGTVTVWLELMASDRHLPSRIARELSEILEGERVALQIVPQIRLTEAGKLRIVASDLELVAH